MPAAGEGPRYLDAQYHGSIQKAFDNLVSSAGRLINIATDKLCIFIYWQNLQ